jgi:metal-responsive CopG/Arc/MetJ family transcriptional regulator
VGTTRISKVVSVSFPGQLLRAAERAAKKEGRAKSELFREALRRYLQDGQWHELRLYGAARAKRLGLREQNVDRLIHQYRKARR